MTFCLKILIVFSVMGTALTMTLLNPSSYMDSDSDTDLANYVASKNYVPNENILPKVSIIKNVESDAIYVLSKLADEELLRLLNEQPGKNEYDLNDIITIADKSKKNEKNLINTDRNQLINSKSHYNVHKNYKPRFLKIPEKQIIQSPVFRLDNKEVDPFKLKHDAEPKYAATNKIKNLLYSRPQKHNSEEDDVDEEKKEMLFDILVGQLKTLCCKKNKVKTVQDVKKTQIKSLLNEMISQNGEDKTATSQNKYSESSTKEHMFLIINDEIKSNESEELVSVDPESIENNCSVLLLGPITTPLSDFQLKLVMRRITNELSKPEYIPLLQQLSEGALNNDNKRLLKSVVSGPDTRRYIKPHRCNHQSKLAKVYGGPKWIICTGYLNLNTPSLYDK